jgi:BirA family biotin operon repressor/biotin-[acetyl-CoA-carboxylase] ligase
MQDAILAFLKSRSEHVSGEELSERLSISRQALWKHIQQLKDDGYEIVAVPHLGYKLERSPDRLLPAEVSYKLGTRVIGRHVEYHQSLSSTMDNAESRAREGAPEGTIIIAEGQSHGRGRMRRLWESPRYKGIYCSLILRPDMAPAQVPLLTLMSGVSVCEAVKDVCMVEARLKWPNDIMIADKKAGGILTEMNAETDVTRFVVVGIGLNVTTPLSQLPAGAVSLAIACAHPISRLALLQQILRRLEQNYQCLRQGARAQILERWREHALTLGRRVKVAGHGAHLEGTAVDVDEDGALLVRTDAGIVRRLTAGDILHCR